MQTVKAGRVGKHSQCGQKQTVSLTSWEHPTHIHPVLSVTVLTFRKYSAAFDNLTNVFSYNYITAEFSNMIGQKELINIPCTPKPPITSCSDI